MSSLGACLTPPPTSNRDTGAAGPRSSGSHEPHTDSGAGESERGRGVNPDEPPSCSLPSLPPVYTPTRGCWHRSPMSHRVLALQENSAASLFRAVSSVHSQPLAPPAALSPQPTCLQQCQKLLHPPRNSGTSHSPNVRCSEIPEWVFPGSEHTGSLMLGASSLSCLHFPLELLNSTRLQLPELWGKCYRLASSRFFLCAAALSMFLVPCHCRERRETAGAPFPVPLNNIL